MKMTPQCPVHDCLVVYIDGMQILTPQELLSLPPGRTVVKQLNLVEAELVMLTSKVLELCARQQRVQGMAKLMKQRFGLVGAHQAATREAKAAH